MRDEADPESLRQFLADKEHHRKVTFLELVESAWRVRGSLDGRAVQSPVLLLLPDLLAEGWEGGLITRAKDLDLDREIVSMPFQAWVKVIYEGVAIQVPGLLRRVSSPISLEFRPPSIKLRLEEREVREPHAFDGNPVHPSPMVVRNLGDRLSRGLPQR